MRSDRRTARNIRTGILVAGALFILVISIFFIGSEQKIFAKKYEYQVELESATGLAEGNPVQMSGVTIGVVRGVELPRDPKSRNVSIELMIDRKYAERIRSDSRVRLKKLGLLAGDTFIDVTPGSPGQPPLEPGSLIPAQRQTSMEQLIGSGESLVENLVRISFSLRNILERVDKGEGLLGELTSTPASQERLTDTLLVTLNRTNRVLDKIDKGQGLVGRLFVDGEYSDRVTESIAQSATSLESILGNVERSFATGDGTIPALMSDPAEKKKILELLENLRVTSGNLAVLTATMQSGEGLVPRLFNDKAYADQTLEEFQKLVLELREVVNKLNSGEGTAGKLISDPAVYESMNDILIGINESAMLRWLIRSRQEAGIETRYEAERAGAASKPSPPPPPAATSSVAPPTEPAPPEIPVVEERALPQEPVEKPAEEPVEKPAEEPPAPPPAEPPS